MLAICKKKVSEYARRSNSRDTGLSKSTPVAFVQRDASKLAGFDYDSFDTVIDTFGLCSIDNPVDALREMKRVTKPGGRILLLEHGKSATYQWLTDFLDRKSASHRAKWGCTWNRDIEGLLDKAGLTDREVKLHHLGTTYRIVCTVADP